MDTQTARQWATEQIDAMQMVPTPESREAAITEAARLLTSGHDEDTAFDALCAIAEQA